MKRNLILFISSFFIAFSFICDYEADALTVKDYNSDSIINAEDTIVIKNDILNSGESDIFELIAMKKYVIKKESSFRSYIDFNYSANIQTVNYNGSNIIFGDTDYRLDSQKSSGLISLLRSVGYDKSFVMYDLNTGGFIGYNINKYYPVASTVKAPMVLTCLQSVDRGEHSLDETMTFTSGYKTGGSGVIKKSAYGTKYSLETIMKYTITESDNVGYYMLQNHFGYAQYNAFLQSLGNKATINGGVKWGQTSAYDSMKNWIQIYNYVTNDNLHSGLFRDMLENTTLSCIRNGVGNKYPVANKMGWMYGTCCHDHAYVMAESPYILIIMTSGNAYDANMNFVKNLAVKLDEIHNDYEMYSYLH